MGAGAAPGRSGSWRPLSAVTAAFLAAFTALRSSSDVLAIEADAPAARALAARHGVPLADALARAGRLRLLPIFLTTVTTLAGLSPRMLEQSFQARFLIPMAISLVFGLMSSSVLTLLVLPAVMVVLDDFVRFFRRLWTGRAERAESLPEGFSS